MTDDSDNLVIEHIDAPDDPDLDPGFYIRNAAGQEPPFLGELTYRWDGDVLVAKHTGVRQVLQGKGVARRLVNQLVATARAEGFKIRAQCPYVARVFSKDPDAYADVNAD